MYQDTSRLVMIATMRALRKFSSQAEPEVLEALQAIADQEGRQLQSVLGEAMREYLARRQGQAPRRNVLEAFQQSLKERDELYRSLAK
jgi:predicted transcriptional regulator